MPSQLTVEQKRWRRRIFAAGWLAYASYYLCRKNFSVVMPLLEEDLGYGRMDLATVIFGFSLLYALGQFTNGVLADRLGPRLVVGVGLLVSVTSNVFMGFTTTLIALILLGCVNGWSQSTGWPALVKNMANWFGQRERGIVMAWWGTNYVLGGFFATIFATYVLTHDTLLVDWGWRRAFWIPALLMAGMTLIFLFLARNKPLDVGVADIPEREGVQDREHTASTRPGAAQRRGPSLPLWSILSEPAIWVIACAYFCMKLTRYAFLFWLPFYLVSHLGYSVQQAGYTSSLYELVGFSGAIFAGYASDRLMQSRRFPVGAIMLWGLAVVCFFQPHMTSFGPWGVAVWVSLVGIVSYGPDNLMSGAAAQDLGSRKGAGSAAGFINGVGSFGQLCSPFLVAYVSERYGWEYLFHTFIVVALFAGSVLASKWNYRTPKLESEPTSQLVEDSSIPHESMPRH